MTGNLINRGVGLINISGNLLVYVGFEVLTAVTLFWVVTPCSPVETHVLPPFSGSKIREV
jgi:hypothetical protein